VETERAEQETGASDVPFPRSALRGVSKSLKTTGRVGTDSHHSTLY